MNPKSENSTKRLARLVALALVCFGYAAPASSEVDPWEARALVEALRSDSIKWNAHKAFHKIIWSDELKASRELISHLENALTAEDHQLRQYATRLLIEHVYPFAGLDEAAWPPAICQNLVEGLHDDNISARSAFPNARKFSKLLYGLENNRPLKLLHETLRGEDSQARFCAAVILSKYLKDSVQPEVSDELVTNLKDDRHYLNEIAAYRGLVLLGRDNVLDVLRRTDVVDWQQAALLECAASRFGIGWSASEANLAEWYERATRQPGPSKRSIAALYLCPSSAEFLQGKELPRLLNRMQKLSPGLRGLAEREQWARTWFWFLRNEEGDRWLRAPFCASYALGFWWD